MDKIRKELWLKQEVVDYFIELAKKEERSVKWLMEKCLENACKPQKESRVDKLVSREDIQATKFEKANEVLKERELVRREKPPKEIILKGTRAE